MSEPVKNGIESLRDELIVQGQRIYDAQLREDLERENRGRFVAIEPTTGRYFLGDTGVEALVAAREAMPDNLFYLARIGRKAAHTIGGHALRIR